MNIVPYEIWKETKDKGGNIGNAIFRDGNSDDLIVDDPKSETVEINKPGAYWLPAMGLTEYDGHGFIAGATGAGKSWLIDQMMQNDIMKKKGKREHIMFTDLKEPDESIKSKYKKFGKDADIRWINDNLDGNMFIFDDSTNPDVLRFRDSMLEKGRHRKATVLGVNHRLRDGTNTKKLINESKYIVTFPGSNRAAVAGFMKDYMQMDTNEIRNSLKKARTDGRHLIFHMWHPNALASSETAWLI